MAGVRFTELQSRPIEFTDPSGLVVKSQAVDITNLILQLIRHLNSVHRACRNRKSRGAVLSTSEGQWATTKFDGVWDTLARVLTSRSACKRPSMVSARGGCRRSNAYAQAVAKARASCHRHSKHGR